jgi:primosomal protein N''
MTTKSSDIPVRLDELASHLSGHDPEQWVREVGGEIEQDWLGRKVTSPAAAVRRWRLATSAQPRARSSPASSMLTKKDWERRYMAVGEEAYQTAAERQLEVEQQALLDSDTF